MSHISGTGRRLASQLSRGSRTELRALPVGGGLGPLTSRNLPEAWSPACPRLSRIGGRVRKWANSPEVQSPQEKGGRRRTGPSPGAEGALPASPLHRNGGSRCLSHTGLVPGAVPGGPRTSPQAATPPKWPADHRWGAVQSEHLHRPRRQQALSSCEMKHESQKLEFYCEITPFFFFFKSQIGN